MGRKYSKNHVTKQVRVVINATKTTKNQANQLWNAYVKIRKSQTWHASAGEHQLSLLEHHKANVYLRTDLF